MTLRYTFKFYFQHPGNLYIKFKTNYNFIILYIYYLYIVYHFKKTIL